MSRHVSWRAGGRADRFYAPASLEELQAFLQQLPAAEPVLFFGLGSNLLLRDGGFRGTVVQMHRANAQPALEGDLVRADAWVAAPKVARFAARHGLAGAEFLAGVPGTVGGALAMNAGCWGAETWDIVAQAETIDRRGKISSRAKDDFAIGYRRCALKSGAEEWFLAASFALPRGDGEVSRERIKALLARRLATQPLELPNAGSVFRNPPGGHAARLIEDCGLKGLERGGARVSEKHANFIVNPKGRASAADIEGLIVEVQKIVSEKKGISLVPEVRIVGERA